MTIPNRTPARALRSSTKPNTGNIGGNESSNASTGSPRPAPGVRDFIAQQRARLKEQQEQDKRRATTKPARTPRSFAGSDDYSWDDTLSRNEVFGQSPPPTNKLETVIKQAKGSGKLNISNRNLEDIPDSVWNMYHVDPNSISVDFSSGSDLWSDQEELTRMIAADNSIKEISERIGEEFGALRHIDFHNNQLTGLPNSFTNLLQITYVNLANNCFKEIPTQLYAINGLRELNMSGNKITTLQPDFRIWTVLESLSINDNELRYLPTDISELRGLRRLYLKGNRLEYLPDGFLTTSSLQLEELELANNSISSIALAAGELKLKRLDVHNNRLKSVTINENTNLIALHELLLGRNKVDHLDNIVESAPNLRVLDISSNSFAIIPDTVLQLEHLNRLDFGSNQLRSLPAKLGLMPNLQVIVWQGNPLLHPPRNMSGSLDVLKSLKDSSQPEAIDEPAYVQKMKDVRLADRSQRGDSRFDADEQVSSVPDQSPHNIKNKTMDMTKKQLDELPLDSLENAGFDVAHLKLDHNVLTSFPSSWGHLSHTLVTISLHRNKLSTFAFSVQLPALKELDMSNNQIQNIDIADSNLAPSLISLNVSCNRLKAIPSNLSQMLPTLTTLLANTNKITVIEPSSFEGIRVLDLGNNDIAQVPPMLGRVTSIKELNLGGNSFRVPRRTTLEAGTESIMEFLRNRIVE
ncbi:hypothetical protein INT43_006324 [Umbelopsis isabellina]|uniref:Leucine-rich repeat-containing protein 40 n=1 Tax=Mortierella isabellina TaxID=91625 RepID=A0A8H7Q1G7_MORIS|nr:hypothetical protein INT43_006324 [Umbelopsis isabellina]